MNEKQSPTTRLGFGTLARPVIAGIAFWLLWVAWKPVFFTLPEDLIRVQDASELVSLSPGSRFLIEGQVYPVAGASGPLWQDRLAYVHLQRKDQSTAAGKDQPVVVIEDRRPALRFEPKIGDAWQLPASSYSLDHAPRIKARFWPRKSLWLMPVDDWHKSSRGFRLGDAAIAYGQMSDEGKLRVDYLLQSPIESATAEIGSENTKRYALLWGFKGVLSVFILLLGLPRKRSFKNPTDSKPQEARQKPIN